MLLLILFYDGIELVIFLLCYSTDVKCLLLYSGPLMDRNLAQMLLCILIVYLFIFSFSILE